LSAGVERPISLIWNDSETSKTEMAEQFDKIVTILHRVERQDIEWNLPLDERFELILR
jgi:ribonuclease inhibitor